MCIDPVSLTIMSTAVSAAGAVGQGMAANKSAKVNAAAYDQQAKSREEKGRFDAEQTERDFERQRGRIIAGIGSSGVESQSFSDILADDMAEKQVRLNAIKYGTDVEATNLRYTASNTRTQGQNALVGSIFQAGSTAMAGYGQVQKIRTLQTRGISINSGDF